MKLPNATDKTFICGWYDTRKDTTIREMAETMKQVVDFEGRSTFDVPKSDGASRKFVNVYRLSNVAWKYKVNLKEGIAKTHDWYIQHVLSGRS
jgi:GDP-L-fucose synthase